MSHRSVALSLAAVMLLGFASSIKEVRAWRGLQLSRQTDFLVYYTAACLLRDHRSAGLYQESGDGNDPQRRPAGRNSMMLAEARAHGIDHLDLYVYPPILADLLLPLSWLPADVASLVWRVGNLLLIVLSAGCISRLLGRGWMSGSTLLVLAGLLCFGPLWQAVYYGQVTLLLLALISAGLLAYQEGWERSSAIFLGVAAAIKLTPLLMVVPFLLWRDWRWLRWWGGTLLASVVLSAPVSSPELLAQFFGRVVPPMSQGIVSRQNETILSALEMLWCRGRTATGMIFPWKVIWAGHLLSAVLVVVAAVLIWRSGRVLPRSRRSRVLAAVALLSLVAAPVAWVDSFCLGYVLLVMLWAEALRGPARQGEVALLWGCSAGVGCRLVLALPPSLTAFYYLPLAASCVLVFWELGRCNGLDTDGVVDEIPIRRAA